MATNKNAIIRYHALDRCFSIPGTKYFIEDLIESCNDAMPDIDPNSSGIKRHQMYEEIKFTGVSLGYDATIESFKNSRKVYYRYDNQNFSIINHPINIQKAQQLKELPLSLSGFNGIPHFKWVEEIKALLEQNALSFEENPYLTGREYIGELYNSIINRETVLTQYKPFKLDEKLQYDLQPYLLIQYNNRCFLYGMTKGQQTITNINFREFFDNIVGVSLPFNEKTKKILDN